MHVHTYAGKLYDRFSPSVEIYRWNQEVRIVHLRDDKVWNNNIGVAINEKKHDTGVHPVQFAKLWKARNSVRACSRLEAEADFG